MAQRNKSRSRSRKPRKQTAKKQRPRRRPNRQRGGANPRVLREVEKLTKADATANVMGPLPEKHSMIEEAMGGLGGMARDFLMGIPEMLLSGVGEYDVVSPGVDVNSLVGAGLEEASQAPAMHRSDNVTRITHREFLQNITMTQLFQVISYPIDPTNALTFPWLSTMALNFQEYMFLGCTITVKSLSANAVSGTVAAMGSITGSIAYDVYSLQPSTKAEAANSMFAASCKPSEDMLIAVECKQSETTLTTFKIATPGSDNSDQHFYQLARIDLVTEGAPNDYKGAAEVWISYDILLLKPRAVATPNVLTSFYNFTPSISATSIFPATQAVEVIDNIGITFEAMGTGAANMTVVLPWNFPTSTLFRLEWCAVGGSTTTVAAPAFGVGNGLQFLTPFGGNQSVGSYSYPPQTAPLSTSRAEGGTTFYYDGTGTPAAPPYIYVPTFVAGNLPLNPGASLLITQLNPLISTHFTRRPTLFLSKLNQRTPPPIVTRGSPETKEEESDEEQPPVLVRTKRISA